jgi:predicted nucleic acid-binding protein
VLILENLHQANNGCISVQSLAEFMNVGLKKLKPPLSPDKAIYQVQLMQNLWQIFDLTPEIVLTAGRGVRDYRLAYYEAQIWATALMNGYR